MDVRIKVPFRHTVYITEINFLEHFDFDAVLDRERKSELLKGTAIKFEQFMEYGNTS